jgi:hypothetical protein
MDIEHCICLSWFSERASAMGKTARSCVAHAVRASAASSDPAMALGPSGGRTGEWNWPVTNIGSSLLPDERRQHLPALHVK